MKTSAALKRALGNTPIGKLIDSSIAKKQAKIEQIRKEKLPKHENKIKIQTAKKEKATAKLGKVNRKIDKVQDFFTAIGSKNKEERHQGFVTGLENLSDIRRTIASVPMRIERYCNELDRIKTELADSQKEVNMPFEHEAELEEKKQELERLTDEINADKVKVKGRNRSQTA